MKYYSQVRFAQLAGLSIITVWRYCKKGRLNVKFIEIEHKDGKLVRMPLIPESELKQFVS